MQWPRLDELDDAVVTAAYEYVVQLIRERHPDADAQRGMLGRFVSELHAIMHAAARTAIAQLHTELAIKDVLANPTATQSALIDKLLANVGMQRTHVEKSSGYVRYTLARPVRVTITQGELLRSADGQVFRASRNLVFKEPDVPLQGYDELHMHNVGNQYTFSFPVQARDTGGVTPRRGSIFKPYIAPPGLLAAVAEDDFHGSCVHQDDADALRMLRMGMTAQGWSGRPHIEAMILKADPAQYRFAADIKALTVVGANDPGGAPGTIRIIVTCRDGVTAATLLEELRAYLAEPARRCTSAIVVVEAAAEPQNG